MALKKIQQRIAFKEQEILVWIPDVLELQQTYQENPLKDNFPFWANLWPAAFALTHFLEEHPQWISNKKVLELAAGLGLPSLLASQYADSVICSDQDQEAVAFINNNIALNRIENMGAACIDWADIPADLEWEVLLMSDVNYNPDNFETLLEQIKQLLAAGKTIILSTPQRLAGKSFIMELLPYCILNEQKWHEQTAINVLVLKS